MIKEHDHREKRCPLLGHKLNFSYCREPGKSIPCHKIYDCWWESFDINGFIENHYSQNTIEKIVEPPKPKYSSLLELIEQAKQRNNS